MRCWMRSRRTSSMSRKILLRRAEMFALISSSCSFAKSCACGQHRHKIVNNHSRPSVHTSQSRKWLALTLTDSRLSMMQKFSCRDSVSGCALPHGTI